MFLMGGSRFIFVTSGVVEALREEEVRGLGFCDSSMVENPLGSTKISALVREIIRMLREGGQDAPADWLACRVEQLPPEAVVTKGVLEVRSAISGIGKLNDIELGVAKGHEGPNRRYLALLEELYTEINRLLMVIAPNLATSYRGF